MSGPEERRRAVDLYSATPMTTAQVVEHLGHPTRQCPERWLAKDPRHAGHMAKPTIPLETKDQGDRTGAGRHARKRAAGRFGAGVGAVNHWVSVFCQIFVGRFGVSFSPFERLFLGRFGFGQSCGLSVIA